jgi:hypothetical protein
VKDNLILSEATAASAYPRVSTRTGACNARLLIVLTKNDIEVFYSYFRWCKEFSCEKTGDWLVVMVVRGN